MRSAKEYKAIREEIYRFIGAYITKHVYAPSNKEIAEAVGISGTTVHRHIIDMIDEGILETDAEPGTHWQSTGDSRETMNRQRILFRVWRSVRRRSLQRNGFARECRLQFLEESRQGATPTERAERSIPLR